MGPIYHKIWMYFRVESMLPVGFPFHQFYSTNLGCVFHTGINLCQQQWWVFVTFTVNLEYDVILMTQTST